MTPIPHSNQPIGYWLKQTDKVLTEKIDNAQAVHGLTRLSWQVLNTLYETGPISEEQLAAQLSPFMAGANLAIALAQLIAQNWITAEPPYQLTDIGCNQHSAVLATQKTIRQQAMQGIAAEEYALTIQVLQRLVANLQAAQANS